ncbi:MAG TPA: DUF2442 domain-containing protein [Sedimentisphaerales bacterium]|mgnify:CR=1 FL=1|nr:DUF2442 domain-containing protein [Sedimentisphaerales bacterium]HRS13366.1 DUF2442 domain-containing protein [Sedimentisphaerales bacterium]
MIPRVVEAGYVRDYVIHLRFADGAEGDIDLKDELEGEVFEPLKDPDRFRAFQVHPELHTITWPNGADFAPEFLYEKIAIPA